MAGGPCVPMPITETYSTAGRNMASSAPLRSLDIRRRHPIAIGTPVEAASFPDLLSLRFRLGRFFDEEHIPLPRVAFRPFASSSSEPWCCDEKSYRNHHIGFSRSSLVAVHQLAAIFHCLRQHASGAIMEEDGYPMTGRTYTGCSTTMRITHRRVSRRLRLGVARHEEDR